MEWPDRIVADPDILAGKPVIRGTRIAVEFVLELLASGQSAAAILENYPGLHRGASQGVIACSQRQV